MITRTINGLVYEIATPSHWQLQGYPIELTYLGGNDGHPSGWFLSCLRFDANLNQRVDMRPLASREAGHRLIEEAFNIKQVG